MSGKILVKLTEGSFPIVLRAHGKDLYSVQYGGQVKSDLHWQTAAIEFGNCLFHRLECDGKIERPHHDID